MVEVSFPPMLWRTSHVLRVLDFQNRSHHCGKEFSGHIFQDQERLLSQRMILLN
jgi:hypothetical protein